jgi:hypothetical protein
MSEPTPKSPTLSGVILRGVKAIHYYVFGPDDEAVYKTENMIRRGLLPVKKVGGIVWSTTAALDKHFEPELPTKPEPAAEPVRIRRKRPSMPRLKFDPGGKTAA